MVKYIKTITMEERIRIIRNHAMGALIKKYSANGLFFTNEEFEKNKGEILQAGGALFRLSELVANSKN